MGLYWPQVWKKGTMEFARPICNPFVLGAKKQAKNAQSWPPRFLGTDY